jgi:hypothetical protein
MGHLNARSVIDAHGSLPSQQGGAGYPESCLAREIFPQELSNHGEAYGKRFLGLR